MKLNQSLKTTKHKISKSGAATKPAKQVKPAIKPNGTAEATTATTAQVANSKPAVGPGADRALFEYIENFRFGHVGDCKCKVRGRCLHSNGLTSLAWEMFCTFTRFKPENYRDYEMPADLETFRKEILAKTSAYESLKETITNMLPKEKRGRISGPWKRYEREFDQLVRRFMIAVGYVRGLTDHEDLTCRRTKVIKELLEDMMSKEDRPYYDRVYLSPWRELDQKRQQEILEKDQNHVQPGMLAKDAFWDIALSLDHAADHLAREYKKTKDPKSIVEELKLMDAARRLFEEEKKLSWY